MPPQHTGRVPTCMAKAMANSARRVNPVPAIEGQIRHPGLSVAVSRRALNHLNFPSTALSGGDTDKWTQTLDRDGVLPRIYCLRATMAPCSSRIARPRDMPVTAMALISSPPLSSRVRSKIQVTNSVAVTLECYGASFRARFEWRGRVVGRWA